MNRIIFLYFLFVPTVFLGLGINFIVNYNNNILGIILISFAIFIVGFYLFNKIKDKKAAIPIITSSVDDKPLL